MDRDYIRNYMREWRENHPGRDAEIARTYRNRHPERMKAADKRYRESFHKKRVAVAGRDMPEVCELCQQPSRFTLVFDHDHKTGLFRGWICRPCNAFLAGVRDSAEFLERAAEYVRNGGLVKTPSNPSKEDLDHVLRYYEKMVEGSKNG